MANSENREVLRATAELIGLAQAMQERPTYACFGASTADLAPIYKATGTVFRELRYEHAAAMALPYRGGHLIGADAQRKRADYLFNGRHELAHVLAGEVGYFLTAEDTMSFSERRADLFALADLTATWWMRQNIAGKKLLYATQWVKSSFRELTEGWSEQRLWDRARLRVQLYREFGI